MDPNYLPTTLEGALAHVAEECAEVTKVCMKVLRFGVDDKNPRTPGVTNRMKLQEEWKDLQGAMERLNKFLER